MKPDNQVKQTTPIDPSLIKFALALAIVSVMVEVVDKVSATAAWSLFAIIVLGLLLNNPVAIGLITLGGRTLERGVS